MRWPFRRKVITEHEAPAKEIKGATIRVKADDYKGRWSYELKAETEQHIAYSDLYEQTIAGSVISTEVDDLFAQGWALQGENPDDVAKVREYLTVVGFGTPCAAAKRGCHQTRC